MQSQIAIFMEHFAKLPSQSSTYRIIYSLIKQRAESEPILEVQGKLVIFDNEGIDLTSKPMLIKLFQCFADSRKQSVAKQELIYKLYNPQKRIFSARQNDSHNRNLTKLLSRARILLKEKFPEKDNIEWFANDKMTQSWSLFRVRDS